jgi:hypothetical protein
MTDNSHFYSQNNVYGAFCVPDQNITDTACRDLMQTLLATQPEEDGGNTT